MRLSLVIFNVVGNLEILIKSSFFLAEYASCKTPSQQDGLCRPPSTCQVLWELSQRKPLSPENKKLLTSSRCGPSEERLVCCPEDSTPSTRSTQLTEPRGGLF